MTSKLPMTPAEARLVEAAIAELRDDGWVSVKDRLPECERALLYSTEVGMYIAYCAGYMLMLPPDITHWLPLPSPPAPGQEEKP